MYLHNIYTHDSIYIHTALSIPYCLNTVGEPRAAAIIRAREKDDAKWSEILLKSESDAYELDKNNKKSKKKILICFI